MIVKIRTGIFTSTTGGSLDLLLLTLMGMCIPLLLWSLLQPFKSSEQWEMLSDDRTSGKLYYSVPDFFEEIRASERILGRLYRPLPPRFDKGVEPAHGEVKEILQQCFPEAEEGQF